MIFTLTLASCAQEKENADAVAQKVLEQSVLPYAKRYSFSAPSYSDLYLDLSLSNVLYGCDIYEYCSDFSVAISHKDIVSELHILVAKTSEKADSLIKKLESRANSLRDKEIYLYDIENAESINAMIYQKDLYVCLAVGENSEIMYEKLSKELK